jgi:hypothetical protein
MKRSVQSHPWQDPQVRRHRGARWRAAAPLVLLVLGGTEAGCVSAADPPPPPSRASPPPAPPPLFVMDGVILEGGFEAVLGEEFSSWVEDVRIVRAPEARTRWGGEGESGAVLLSRPNAPDPGVATLREVLEHHLGILEALYEVDPRTPEGPHIAHAPRPSDPGWRRVLLVVDGEIMPRHPSLPDYQQRGPPDATGALPARPPPDWLTSLGDEPAESLRIRSTRGAEAAALYGSRSWFGVVRVATGASSGSGEGEALPAGPGRVSGEASP